MALSGVLRAAGDARRAMYVTLSGGVITAFTDPLLIFGFGLGVYGAAWATVISRFVFLAVGLYGAVRVHNMVGRPEPRAILSDFTPIMGIGLPAILANLATPVSAVYVTRVWSDFGEAAVAGGAIVDRVIPLAFGVIFALSGLDRPDHRSELRGEADGPRAPRDFRRLHSLHRLRALRLGGARPRRAVDRRRCSMRTGRAPISCCCSAATAARLGCSSLVCSSPIRPSTIWAFPLLSMIFNWGRATLGTIPFVTLGARWFGIEGAMVGLILGAAIFGLGGVAVAFGVTARLAREMKAA